MKTIESLIPGSPAWLQSRSASKAPAVMGASKYQTRGDLLKQMATGIKEDVNPATQALFDAGHASEAAAREIAEDILCDGLSPVCGESDDGYLTASFDGLTFDGKIGFEHKLWNEEFAAAVRAGTVPDTHAWQMDQQILVGGLDYVLFMVSDGTREKCVSMEYRSSPERAAKLLAGWKQFDVDLANYQHQEVIPAAVAAPQMQLPAVSIQVNGSIALIDNLAVFGDALTSYVGKINQKPETDQDFADLDATVKTLKTAEDALTAAENGALAQTASIDQMRRQVAQYREIARVARLQAEKTVKAEKENRRAAIVLKASKALADHIAGLNTRLGKPYMPAAHGDFGGCIKGLKTITSIQNACDSELARCKIEANEIADRLQMNLASLRELAADHAFLFADTPAIIQKANDDLVALIKSRIAEHKEAEAKKLEAIKEAARIEAEKNAEAKAKAEQEAASANTTSRQEATATAASAPANMGTGDPPASGKRETPPQSVITGTAKLRDLIDDELARMTAKQLQMALDSLISINTKTAA